MGSTKRFDSNRAAEPARRLVRADGLKQPPGRDTQAILGRLSDAIAFVATAGNALLHAQEHDGTLHAGSLGSELVALQHGIGALRYAYEELDVAMRGH